jgi:hypothetical protein
VKKGNFKILKTVRALAADRINFVPVRNFFFYGPKIFGFRRNFRFFVQPENLFKTPIAFFGSPGIRKFLSRTGNLFGTFRTFVGVGTFPRRDFPGISGILQFHGTPTGHVAALGFFFFRSSGIPAERGPRDDVPLFGFGAGEGRDDGIGEGDDPLWCFVLGRVRKGKKGEGEGGRGRGKGEGERERRRRRQEGDGRGK